MKGMEEDDEVSNTIQGGESTGKQIE